MLGPRAAAGAAALALVGCASVQPPSGGPEDRTAPVLASSRPAPRALVPGWRGPVVLAFDERLSERGVDQAVEVSPRTSAVVVRHSGDELRVSLREGWRPGVVYHVNVLPGLRDLFGNESAEPLRLVFSTGPEIADTRLAGTAIDRTDLEPMPELRVEAIRAADSLVYAAATDSVGGFVIANLPEGDYLVRAFDDLNANRALDDFEPRDAATAVVSSTEPVEVALSVVLPDSTPPTVAGAALAGRIVTVEFDDLLDPAQDVPAENVEIRGPGGGVVPVSRAAVGELAEEDTTPERPTRPSRELAIELAADAELRPGEEYTVTIGDVRNIVGLAVDAVATFTVPEDEPEPGGILAPDGRPDA